MSPNHRSSTPKDVLTHHGENKDQTLSQILKDLEQSGIYTELQNDTRTLLYKSGWHDAMKQLAIQRSIHEGGGLTNVTLDDVAVVLLNEGRDCVPENVKNLVHQRVLGFVEKGQDYE